MTRLSIYTGPAPHEVLTHFGFAGTCVDGPPEHGLRVTLEIVERRTESPDTVITSSRLLEGLPDAIIDDFLRIARFVDLDRGQAAFVEGERSDCLYLVVAGKLKIERSGRDGPANLMSIVGPGDMLGELALFDGLSRHATATALRESRVARVDNDLALEWLKRHPEELLLRFARLFTARIRRINNALEDTHGVDIPTRVARALVNQGTRFGRQTDTGLRLDLDLSQEELALYVRASRERVNQVMADFARRGWVLRDGRELHFTDFDAVVRRARYNERDSRRRGDGFTDS